MSDDCLLTEFRGKRLKSFFRERNWGAKLGILFLGGSLLVIMCGHLGRANALNRQIDARIRLADGVQALNPVNFVGGYLGQANHGFYYLILAPLFVVFSARFLYSADEALKGLCAQGRLARRTLMIVGRINYRRFRWLWLLLPIIFIGYGLRSELAGYQAVKSGKSDETGYVQAPFLDMWTNSLRMGGWRFLAKRQETEEIELHSRAALQAASPESLKLWVSVGALHFSDPTNAVPELWRALARKGAFVLDLQKAYDAGLLSLDAKLARFPKTTQELIWHGIFFLGVQCLEGAFYAFVAWVALKAIFWMLILWRFLPGPKRKGRLALLVTDPRKHFGLSELNEPYNRLVLLLALGAFAFPLVIISGIPRISPGDLTASVQAFMSVFLLTLAIGAPALVLGVGPIFFFNRRLKHLRTKELARLDDQLGKSQANPQLVETIEKQKDVIEQQTCWPKEDAGFKRLILATIFFAVIPVCLHFRYVPHEAEKYLSAVRICDDGCKKAVDMLYHVTQL